MHEDTMELEKFCPLLPLEYLNMLYMHSELENGIVQFMHNVHSIAWLTH